MAAKNKRKRKIARNEAIRDFVETYPKARDVKLQLWELLIAAMGSDHADMWDKRQRADKLLFMELLGALLGKLY